jgi:hypothetical protein
MSDAMKLLQAKCGVSADGDFGPNTARAIAKHYDLKPERAAHVLGQASHESGGFKLSPRELELLCGKDVSRFGLIGLNHLRPLHHLPATQKRLAEKDIFRSYGE